MPENRVEIDRKEFLLAMKTFKKARLRHGPAVMAFGGSIFSIDADSVVATMKAQGQWEGQARISIHLLKAFVEAPPSGDPIVVRCDGQFLSFGTTKVACNWVQAVPMPPGVPQDRTPLALLALERMMPRASVVRGELASEVKEANELLAKRLASAALTLSEFGVSDADLADLVNEKIRRRMQELGELRAGATEGGSASSAS
jgi:hypothetical protein